MYAGVPSTVPTCVRSEDSTCAMPKSATLAVPSASDEDVRRLDVAVDDAQLVRVAERRQDLRQDAHDVDGREALVLLEVVLELAPVHELHRDVPDAGVLAEVVDARRCWDA